MRLVLALLVAIAIAACTRIVVLSEPQGDGGFDSAHFPDAVVHLDGGPLPDAFALD